MFLYYTDRIKLHSEEPLLCIANVMKPQPLPTVSQSDIFITKAFEAIDTLACSMWPKCRRRGPCISSATKLRPMVLTLGYAVVRLPRSPCSVSAVTAVRRDGVRTKTQQYRGFERLKRWNRTHLSVETQPGADILLTISEVFIDWSCYWPRSLAVGCYRTIWRCTIAYMYVLSHTVLCSMPLPFRQ